RDPRLPAVPARRAARQPARDSRGERRAMSAALELPDRPVRVALVGAPNAGKTTLFNSLTGSSARVGNYPGVTVERREGTLRNAERAVRVLDLPGTYSVVGETPDEQIVEKVLAGRLAGGAPAARPVARGD